MVDTLSTICLNLHFRNNMTKITSYDESPGDIMSGVYRQHSGFIFANSTHILFHPLHEDGVTYLSPIN